MSTVAAFVTPTVGDGDWLRSASLRRRVVAAVCVVGLVALFARGLALSLPGSVSTSTA